MIDWGQATQVAGIGFLTVFVTLGILSAALSLVSYVMYKVIKKQA